MQLLFSILKNRRRCRQNRQRSPLLKLGFAASLAVSLAVVVVVAGVYTFYQYLIKDIADIDDLPALIEPPGGMIYHPTRLYDRTGKHLILSLENPAAKGIQYLPLDEKSPEHLPHVLAEAVVSVADPEFWRHHGFLWNDKEANTIAERLVAKFLLWHEPPGWRKDLRRKYLAAQITQRFGRERVLEWHLNSINFGRLAFGADAAARVYFGKPATQLNLAEAALLAATAQAPALNPLDAPQAARERQQQVLDLLLRRGSITQQEANAARQSAIPILPSKPVFDETAPAFTQMAIEQLVGQFGWERLERGGMQVLTTLDFDLQTQLTCTAQIHLNRLQERTAAQERTTQNEYACEAARLLPAMPPQSSQPPTALAADVVILDVHSGQILALFSSHPPAWESALEEGRPPGSLLTPFVYLAGFTRGYTPATLVWDLPSSGGTQATPHYGKGYDGAMRLRFALANDQLAVATDVLKQTGAETVWRSARQMGLYLSDMANHAEPERVLWEGGEARLLEITQAYATIANQGNLTGQVLPNPNLSQSPSLLNLTPSALLKVTEQDGKTWLDWSEAKTKPVLSPPLAYLITHVLSDETARWKSLGHPNPLEINRPAAVKIGRTQDGRDTWTIGYTPDLTIGVWLGALELQKDEGISYTSAAPLWNAMLAYASRNTAAKGWEVPRGVRRVEVCDPSGMLPSPYCPEIVSEVFLNGTEPSQADTLYYTRQINRETGKLATIFTAADEVEDKIYMHIPAGGEEWARQENLPLPPRDYDTLYIPSSRLNAAAHITTPLLLENVRETVEIHGTAGGEGFSFYRIEVGQGLNPAHWYQVGDDVKTAVRDGRLGIWDTKGLNGLYVIQLLVVRETGKMETATVQVTVDNRPPQVQIVYPKQGDILTGQMGAEISLQVRVEDDIELRQVKFLLNGNELAEISQPPYAVMWKAETGKQKLTVTGSDRAGNSQSDTIEFVVED